MLQDPFYTYDNVAEKGQLMKKVTEPFLYKW